MVRYILESTTVSIVKLMVDTVGKYIKLLINSEYVSRGINPTLTVMFAYLKCKSNWNNQYVVSASLTVTYE